MEDECQICCNPIKFYSIAACDHPIFCNICTLRLRILKKDLRCPLCQIESSTVIFTKTKQTYSTFSLPQLKHDTKLGIYFDSKATSIESISILQYHCPVADCPSRNLGGIPHLTGHLSKKHKLLTCGLCLEYKHLFPSEIETFFTKAELARHKSKGDKAFKGHTFCQHCNEFFYDKDALYTHVRSRHEVCFLCARDGHPEQIYDNYTTLEYHFNNDHYACREPACLEKKFVAFGSDIDLQGHIVNGQA
jgi:5-methylcytosine-specific restriction endonuclease McrA